MKRSSASSFGRPLSPSSSVTYLINKVDITIFGSSTEPYRPDDGSQGSHGNALLECTTLLMRIIQSEYAELPDDVFKYQMYPVSTKYTQECFRQWNLLFNGRASIEYEARLKRVVLKGRSEEKEKLKGKLKSTYSNHYG